MLSARLGVQNRGITERLYCSTCTGCKGWYERKILPWCGMEVPNRKRLSDRVSCRGIHPNRPQTSRSVAIRSEIEDCAVSRPSGTGIEKFFIGHRDPS